MVILPYPIKKEENSMYSKLRKPISVLLLLCLLFSLLPPVSAYAEKTTDSGTTPSGIPFNRLEPEIDRYVNTYIGKSTPGAAVVITRGDRIIFSKGYGYANLEDKTPVDPANTVFAYGSINKTLVWTAVMQLAEAGKMKLDQDIRAYFPKELGDKLRYDKPITMLDIMSHTAGFEQHPLSTFSLSSENLDSLEATLLSSQPEQIYEPGTVIAYSNFATALAALAVEKVSGEPFYDYEMNHILRPLGMNRSSGHPALADHPELRDMEAAGYAVDPDSGFEVRKRHYVPMYPAGAMEGTAEDLARFAMALNKPDSPLFARPETLRTMLSRSYTPDEAILSNAHGFWEYRAQPHVVGHSGNVKGFSGNFAVVPEERLGIVVLTNTEIEQKLTSGIIDLLVKEEQEAPVPQAPAAELQPSRELAGYYVQSGGTYSTYHEVLNYLGLIKITPKGEHDFTLRVMGMSGEMKQIRPKVYQFAQAGDPRFERLAPILYAEMSKEGQVVRLSKGIATDILPIQGRRSLPALFSYLAWAILTVLCFGLAPFVLLVRFLLRIKKGRSHAHAANRWLTSAVLCGTLLVANNLYMLANGMLNENVTVSQMNLGVALDWTFALLGAALFAVSFFRNGSLPPTRWQRAGRYSTCGLFAGYLLLLTNWHFFHFIP